MIAGTTLGSAAILGASGPDHESRLAKALWAVLQNDIEYMLINSLGDPFKERRIHEGLAALAALGKRGEDYRCSSPATLAGL